MEIPYDIVPDYNTKSFLCIKDGLDVYLTKLNVVSARDVNLNLVSTRFSDILFPNPCSPNYLPSSTCS